MSLDHHSQGVLIVATLFFLVIRAWWSLLGLILYGIMHFQYGGTGTFQHPYRNDSQEATIADAVYLVIGFFGLVIMLWGIARRIAEVFA
ncbi:MAG: hypothetical protein HQL10_01190 [Nitrospirae bacterium]|nr:hypothetical protein [Nitrospirota bacterium]